MKNCLMSCFRNLFLPKSNCDTKKTNKKLDDCSRNYFLLFAAPDFACAFYFLKNQNLFTEVFTVLCKISPACVFRNMCMPFGPV